VSLARVDSPSRRVLFASFGAALFILSLGALDPLTRGAVDLPALIPPFGASTVIVFFMPETAAGRVWNVLAGHLGSALVALGVLYLIPESPVVMQAALAVAGAGVWMVLSKSIHPPGGATALLATLGAQKLGVAALLLPLLAGCGALVGIRWLVDRSVRWWEEPSQQLEVSLARSSLLPPTASPSDAP
jgi:CBS domain-containing membrane protein